MVFSPTIVLLPLLWTISQVIASEVDQSASIYLERRLTARNVPPEGYYNPTSYGGSMLTQVDGTFPPGQGEPINVIISGKSDAAALVDQQANGGLQNFFQSLGFGGECLGQHVGSNQRANLGDGKGYINDTAEMRWAYGDSQFGTCKETVQGGNHFRYWTQNGANANSGAVFMATSYELPLAQEHDIIPNGYNLGRDWLVGNITQTSISTLSLSNTSTFSGTTSANNYTYLSTIEYVSGLSQNTSIGINHNITVAVNGQNAVDGLVAIMEVRISGGPGGNRSAAVSSLYLPFYGLLIVTVMLLSLLS